MVYATSSCGIQNIRDITKFKHILAHSIVLSSLCATSGAKTRHIDFDFDPLFSELLNKEDGYQLNTLMLAQLQQEDRNYGLTNIPKSRVGYIDLILDHLENNDPLREMRNKQPQEATGEAPKILSTFIAFSPRLANRTALHSRLGNKIFFKGATRDLAHSKFTLYLKSYLRCCASINRYRRRLPMHRKNHIILL